MGTYRARAILVTSVMAVFLCLSAGDASAQGLFTDEGQSAAFFVGQAFKGDDYHGFGFDIGLAFNGQIDVGIATAKATQTIHYTFWDGINDYYTYSDDITLWNTGFFLREYPIRHRDRRGSEFVFFLNQGLSWVSPDLVPSNNPLRVFQFGAGAAFIIKAGESVRLAVNGSYARLMPSGGLEGSNAFDVGALLQIPFSRGSFVIGPEVAFGEDLTTYGIALGITAIGKDKGKPLE